MQTLKQLKNKIKQSQETLCDNVDEFKEHFANKFSQLIGKYVFINNDYVKITRVLPYMSVDIEDYRK